MKGGLLAEWLGAAPFTIEQTRWILITCFAFLAAGYLVGYAVYSRKTN